MLEDLHDKLEDWRESAERRRDELLRALEAGEVAEPISISIGIVAILKAVAISAVLTLGTSLLTRALTPRQKFTSGVLQGSINIPQSDQGIGIPEGYGCEPVAYNRGA